MHEMSISSAFPAPDDVRFLEGPWYILEGTGYRLGDGEASGFVDPQWEAEISEWRFPILRVRRRMAVNRLDRCWWDVVKRLREEIASVTGTQAGIDIYTRIEGYVALPEIGWSGDHTATGPRFAFRSWSHPLGKHATNLTLRLPGGFLGSFSRHSSAVVLSRMKRTHYTNPASRISEIASDAPR